MSSGTCDTRIYERLTELEKHQARVEVAMEGFQEHRKEVRDDIKALKKSTVVMEVRLGIVIAGAVFIIHWLFK